MSLRDIDLPVIIDTSSSDLFEDFFIPVLAHATRYDRGVGYFSSGWMRMASRGMTQFAANGGRARWVTSPILDESDWNALLKGDQARNDPILYALLKKDIAELENTLEQDTLSALAWMVADEILEFKIALPYSKLEQGDFHDKFGIFTDLEGNQVSFNGSYNDSIQGTRNYESIKIFSSWEPFFATLVKADANRFEHLWNNLDPNVRVFDLPSAAREQILRLRSSERPYPKPNWLIELGIGEGKAIYRPPIPKIPTEINLRDYQLEAINAWFENQRRGVLEMATGTGKTITALSAAVRLFEQEKRFVLVISCPYKHLVEQWASEATKFGFRPIKVAESRKKWIHDAVTQIRFFRKQHCDVVTIITTNNSLIKGPLPGILEEIWENTLFIADEAHHVGAPKTLEVLPQKAPWRLGLSATPVRHYDAEGTDAILNYFGKTVFIFGLEEAIGVYLTPYYYYPIPVEMTDDEFDEFSKLTKKLGKFKFESDEPMPEAAQKIAIKRARIMNNSTSKLDWVRKNIKNYSKIKHTLFYVGDQMFNDVRKLLGVEKRIRIHEFTQRQNNREREKILEQFSSGELQVLIAMKCLDEGVDVPPTRTAYFLASSGNPREFVQRRGRVLRRSEGKEFATLYDLVSIPPLDFIEMGKNHPDYGAIRAAIRREYKRIKEFAELAENQYQALDSMFDFAEKLGLLDV